MTFDLLSLDSGVASGELLRGAVQRPLQSLVGGKATAAAPDPPPEAERFWCGFVHRCVTAQGRASGKSSSLTAPVEGSWRGALPHRYARLRPSVGPGAAHHSHCPTSPLDVAPAPGVDRGRGDPFALRLCSGPLRRLCVRRGQTFAQHRERELGAFVAASPLVGRTAGLLPGRGLGQLLVLVLVLVPSLILCSRWWPPSGRLVLRLWAWRSVT